MKTGKRLPSRIELVLGMAIMSLPMAAVGATVDPYTVNFTNLATGSTPFQHIYSAFTFPKFDASLGTLQSVNFALNFSGALNGTAAGVTFPTVTHAVFFDFEDLPNRVSIAEPALTLTRNALGTVSFGPQFLSTSVIFSVGSGDPRFESWRNGPGNVTAILGVFFDNYALDPVYGLQFFDGTETGVFGGSYSISYTYTPVPEPGALALVAAGFVFIASARREMSTRCRL